jgi:uncharacterized protein (DUF302 family)
MAIEGLTSIQSESGYRQTSDRLTAALAAAHMTVFARIDHADGARNAALDMLPMEVVIFGAAKAGTPLMQAAPTIGIDLPLKVLIWNDASGKTWISYNDPEWLARRHALPSTQTAIVIAMSTLLKNLAATAAGLIK